MEHTSGMHPTNSEGLSPAVFQHWTHSREEDVDGVQVYRPQGFDFPPARGREGFEIRQDGTFVQHDIGPADGTVQVPGRWQLAARGRIAVSFPGMQREGFAFEIEAVNDTMLRLRRVPEGQGTDDSPRYSRAQGLDEAQLKTYKELPAAESHRRIDFERAEIVTLESFPPQFVLQVSGTKPYRNMAVELVPLIYVRRPEYWGIEVVGSLRGIGLPAEAPYAVSLPLTGTLGTRGIEVIGATRTEVFDIPPEQGQPGECRDWQAWLDQQPPGPPTLHVSGMCEFPTAGFKVELRRHEPQGFNPRDLLLEKVVQPPTGHVPQVVTSIEVRYSEQSTEGFDTVTILPEGTSIQVGVVH